MMLPFIYIGIGMVLGLTKNRWILSIFEPLSTVALGLLMFGIGANIGSNEQILANIGTTGFYCFLIALGTIVMSVFLSVLAEKIILPLEQIKQTLLEKRLSVCGETEVIEEGEAKLSLFMIGIPLYILAGVGAGYFWLTPTYSWILDWIFDVSLFFIYVGVGVGLGADLGVFNYIQLLGWRVLILSGTVLVGTLTGGFLMGLISPFSMEIVMIASGGIGYYSLTTLYMTQTIGVEAGVYGFMINAFREFITILILPFLVRLGTSAPTAAAGSGSMDTMLLPVTRFVGKELGIVTLVTGVVLTLIIPFLLPVLHLAF